MDFFMNVNGVWLYLKESPFKLTTGRIEIREGAGSTLEVVQQAYEGNQKIRQGETKMIVTDTPETNLSNALNLFFVRNGEAYVRGYGENGEGISLIDLVKRIAKQQRIRIPYEISEYLTDCLCDNEPESKEGLLALFYTAAWAFAEIRERLKKYEKSGLEPEEIEAMKADIDVQAEKNNPLTLDELRKMDGEPSNADRKGVAKRLCRDVILASVVIGNITGAGCIAYLYYI